MTLRLEPPTSAGCPFHATCLFLSLWGEPSNVIGSAVREEHAQ